MFGKFIVVTTVVAVLAATVLSGTQGSPIAPSTAPQVDTLQAKRDSMMNLVLASIAGRENEPAESVFKDIRSLKGMPAGRVPRIMNLGYSKSLGVSCSHCHVASDWVTDRNGRKAITRQMAAMADTINTRMLPGIPGLRSAQPTVNCSTCHRGEIKPSLEVPAR